SLVRTEIARGRESGLLRRGGRGSPRYRRSRRLPRRRAAAASGTWQYLLLETSRKVVWTVPASARERVYGPSAALLLGPAGSRERERSTEPVNESETVGFGI